MNIKNNLTIHHQQIQQDINRNVEIQNSHLHHLHQQESSTTTRIINKNIFHQLKFHHHHQTTTTTINNHLPQIQDRSSSLVQLRPPRQLRHKLRSASAIPFSRAASPSVHRQDANAAPSSTAPSALGPDRHSSTADVPTAQQIIHKLLSGESLTSTSRRGFLTFNYAKNLETSVMAMISKIWADSTLNNRNRLWTRLNEFAATHNFDLSTNLDWIIPMYCEHTARESSTIPATRLTYAKSFAAIATRLSTQVPITRMYMSGLRANGADRPTAQAPAMWPDHVFEFALRALTVPVVGTRLYATIFIMWKTASRFDEVARLTSKQLTFLDNNSTIVIDWSNRTKSSRLDPNRHDTFIKLAHLPQLPAPVITALQTELPRPSQLMVHTDSWFNKWLHKAQATATFGSAKQYTGHSIKAGAVQVLSEMAISGHISMPTISLLAKHKVDNVNGIASTTLRYIRDPTTKASLNESYTATSLMPWIQEEDLQTAANLPPVEEVPEDLQLEAPMAMMMTTTL